jgi:hypothetical protein
MWKKPPNVFTCWRIIMPFICPTSQWMNNMFLGFEVTLFLPNKAQHLGQGIAVYIGSKSFATLINSFPSG